VRGGRSGSVLAAVVLVLLGMTLLAHGAYLLATRQLQISEVSRELLRASLAAEAGLGMAAQEPGLMEAVTGSSVPLARGWGDRSSLRIGSQPLTTELAWLTAEGESMTLPVPVRLARLVWTLDPFARVADAGAVVVARSETGVGVSAGEWWSVPMAADTLACRAAQAEMLLLGARTPVSIALSADSVALGRIPLAALEAYADLRVPSVVTPGPVPVGGNCPVGPVENWGDPSSSTSPCAPVRPLVWSPTALSVVGGVGQGILATAGAVTFSAGAQFRGIVIASGDVTVAGGSTIEGMVLSGAGVSMESGGQIRGSACAAWAALDAAKGLRFPITVEPRRRLYLP
jgi:hypothetical protein